MNTTFLSKKTKKNYLLLPVTGEGGDGSAGRAGRRDEPSPLEATFNGSRHEKTTRGQNFLQKKPSISFLIDIINQHHLRGANMTLRGG